MEERAACALLKQRFEAAGFRIDEHRIFDEGGVRFELDGFDVLHRVGYEYKTEEAGDSWDVDDEVIAALDARRRRGELHILIIDETDAPDAGAVGAAADTFLAELRDLGVVPAPSEPASPAGDTTTFGWPPRKPMRAASKPRTTRPKPPAFPKPKSSKKKTARR